MSAAAACCLSALCSAVGAADNPSRGVALKGQVGAFGSWVKSKGFPVGRQHVAAYGAGVGYYAARMSYFAFFNRHQAIHSVPRGLLLYRRYEGYAFGASVRCALGEVKYLGAPFGVGVMLSGSYDRYTVVRQYMAYPSVGAEAFLAFGLFRNNIFPVEVSLPLIYAFRRSGHFVNLGISLHVGLCTPQKH